MSGTRDRAGFTLAELLIVVAIIGVLAAVAIPVFAGTLDKTQAQVCAANRAMLTREVLYEKMLDTKDSDIIANYGKDEIREKGYICPIDDNDLILNPPSPDSDFFSVTCSGKQGHGGGPADYDFADTFNKHFENNGVVYNKIMELLDKNKRDNLPRVDSNAPDGGNYSDEIIRCLAEATNHTLGIGMTKTWSISPITKNASGGLGSYQLFWTSEDISECKAGDRILVMRYNSSYNGAPSYIAAWATVTTSSVNGSAAYPVIDQTNFTNINDSADKDFSSAYGIFQDELQKSGGSGIKNGS